MEGRDDVFSTYWTYYFHNASEIVKRRFAVDKFRSLEIKRIVWSRIGSYQYKNKEIPAMQV